jgi:hypothetical protein
MVQVTHPRLYSSCFILPFFFPGGNLTNISLINHSHLSQTFPKIKEREKGNGFRGNFLVNELHHFYYV